MWGHLLQILPKISCFSIHGSLNVVLKLLSSVKTLTVIVSMAKLQDDKDIKEAEDTAYKHEDDAVSLLNTSSKLVDPRGDSYF